MHPATQQIDPSYVETLKEVKDLLEWLQVEGMTKEAYKKIEKVIDKVGNVCKDAAIA